MNDMDDQCSVCDAGTLAKQVVPFVFSHGGEQITIEDHQTICDACGTVTYAGDEISRHELAVAAKIRELDGLLSAEDLRRIRLRYAFRQTDLEAMLSVGPKTWTRWERGKVPQSKAADTLIRVIADDPDVARRLMIRARIENPDAVAAFAAIDKETQRFAEARLRTHIDPSIPDMNVDDLAQRAITAVREARQEWAGKAA
jgi:putative zinc finger/helix-turn-helix YgiT family protein